MVESIGVNKEIRARYDMDRRKGKKEITCKKCGEILLYDDSDVKSEDERINAYEDETLYLYVRCPHCRNKIILEDFRQKLANGNKRLRGIH